MAPHKLARLLVIHGWEPAPGVRWPVDAPEREPVAAQPDMPAPSAEQIEAFTANMKPPAQGTVPLPDAAGAGGPLFQLVTGGHDDCRQR